MAPGSSQFRKLAGLAMATLLICLVVAEIGLRLTPDFSPPTDPPRQQEPHLFQQDERFGYRLWRSTNMLYRYPKKNPVIHSLVSNSDGFRTGREFDELDPRLRVLMLGDSVAFGMGVEVDDRVTEVMESLEPDWRVDNAAMAGYGLDLMIRALEAIGPKSNPDVIVLTMHTDDFRRLLPYYAGLGYKIPKFHLEGQRLVTRPFPRQPFWKRIRLVHAFYFASWKKIYVNNWKLHEALLDRYRELAHEMESLPVVVFIPGQYETPNDQRRRVFLKDYCAQKETPFLDLTEALHREGVKETHVPRDMHWNEQGHRVAAEALGGFLGKVVEGLQSKHHPVDGDLAEEPSVRSQTP